MIISFDSPILEIWPTAALQVGSVSFRHVLTSFLNTSIFSSGTRCFRFICMFSFLFLDPWNQPFLQGAISPEGRVVFRLRIWAWAFTATRVIASKLSLYISISVCKLKAIFHEPFILVLLFQSNTIRFTLVFVFPYF